MSGDEIEIRPYGRLCSDQKLASLVGYAWDEPEQAQEPGPVLPVVAQPKGITESPKRPRPVEERAKDKFSQRRAAFGPARRAPKGKGRR